jgi:hypothetical protein
MRMRINKGNLSEAISRKSCKKSGCNGAADATASKHLQSESFQLNQLDHIVKRIDHNILSFLKQLESPHPDQKLVI